MCHPQINQSINQSINQCEFDGCCQHPDSILLPLSILLFVGVPVFTASAHQPTVVLNTAEDLLDTNQTHQRLVLHNLTQAMTYCCPVKTHVD